MLEVKSIAKSFGGLRVLEDVSFNADPGRVTALIGPNGAGKSTLVNLVSGALTPDSGEVILDGEKVTGLPSHQLFRRGITRTFQISRNVGDLNVFESIAIAAYRQAKGFRGANALAREELKRFELWQYRDRKLGDIPTALMRVVDFARAMVSNPKVLLLDEVMAGLTPHEVDIVIEQVRSCRDQGVAIVMIEHVMQAISALAQQVYVLNQGRIIADGTLAQVGQQPEVVEAYLGTPLSNDAHS